MYNVFFSYSITTTTDIKLEQIKSRIYIKEYLYNYIKSLKII